MRAAVALWIIGAALILAAVKYDPDAGNRLLIDNGLTPNERSWQ